LTDTFCLKSLCKLSETFYFTNAKLANAQKKVSNSSLLCQPTIRATRSVIREMAYVSVNNNESIESALRRFKRKVITEEIIKDLKRHAHFVPPGQKAKLKSANARKRNRKRFRPTARPMNQNQNQNFNQNR